jgi:hypothetical protein
VSCIAAVGLRWSSDRHDLNGDHAFDDLTSVDDLTSMGWVSASGFGLMAQPLV